MGMKLRPFNLCPPYERIMAGDRPNPHKKSRVMMKLVIIFTSLLLMLSGCAARKLVIRNADSIIEMAVRKRIPLSSEQRQELSRDIDQLLTQYKDEGRQLLPVVDEIDLSDPDKTEKHYLQLSGLYLQVARDFTGMLAKHLARLDSTDQQSFFKELTKENRELEKKQKKDRLKDFNGRFSWFFGSVSQEQKDLFNSYTGYFNQRYKLRLEERRQLQANLKSIYASVTQEEARRSAIHTALMDFQNNRVDDPTNLEIIKKFRPTLSTKQLQHLQDKKAEMKDIINYYIQVNY
jgi:hypothetical protein